MQRDIMEAVIEELRAEAQLTTRKGRFTGGGRDTGGEGPRRLIEDLERETQEKVDYLEQDGNLEKKDALPTKPYKDPRRPVGNTESILIIFVSIDTVIALGYDLPDSEKFEKLPVAGWSAEHWHTRYLVITDSLDSSVAVKTGDTRLIL